MGGALHALALQTSVPECRPPKSVTSDPVLTGRALDEIGNTDDSAGLHRPARKVRRDERYQTWIDNEVKSNDVVLFMKGTPTFPQCGFSGQVVQILDYLGVDYKGVNVLENADIRAGHQGLLQLADHPAALRQGRVRRRLRHHPRDVPGRRAADPSSPTRASPVAQAGLRAERIRRRFPSGPNPHFRPEDVTGAETRRGTLPCATG